MTIGITSTIGPTWTVTPTPTSGIIDQTGVLTPTLSEFPGMSSSSVEPEDSSFGLSSTVDFPNPTNSEELITMTTIDMTEGTAGELPKTTMESTWPPYSDLTPTPTTPWVTAVDTEIVSPSYTPGVTASEDNLTSLTYTPTVTDGASTDFLSPMPSETTISYEPTETMIVTTATIPEETTIVVSSETDSYYTTVPITPSLETDSVSVSVTPIDSASVIPSDSIYPSPTASEPFETVTPSTSTEDSSLINATSTDELTTTAINATTTEGPLANGTSTEEPINLNATTPADSVTMNDTYSEGPVSANTTSSEGLSTTSSAVTDEPVTQNFTTSEETVTMSSTSTVVSVTMNVTVSEQPVTVNDTTSEQPVTVSSTFSEEPVTMNATVPEPPITSNDTVSEPPVTESPETRNTTITTEPISTQPSGGDTGTEFSTHTQPITPTSFENITKPMSTTSTSTTQPIIIISPSGPSPTTTGSPLNVSEPCSNYCQNNAKCISTSIEPICLCPFKFTGKQCETVKEKVMLPSFKGNSFLQYKLPTESVKVVDVSIKMATIVPDGIVLYTSSSAPEGSEGIFRNSSYGLVFIQNGHLTLHFSCGSQSMQFTETRTRIDNGYNFTLDFRMEMIIDGVTNELHCFGKLSVNQSFVMSGEQLVGKGSLPLFENIYVGGVDQKVSRSEGNNELTTFLPGFRGCVYNLKVSFEYGFIY